MREIKFRIWHKERKMMIYSENQREGQYCISQKGDVLEISDFPCIVTDKVEVMQFTGLQDNKGKQIFEGDIVVLSLAIEPFEIKWKDDAIGGPAFDFQHFPGYLLKIIGNIYENPELLEKINDENN